ncbi:hypothetical protein CMQ_3356 [Grosmannia clavigera kw1407]|uniref:HAUS augmin-like complex subunit 6 N-terminal domain-containing protein n=1 Tax=Grosmannia clavigera (strain kw1407 / UAMH 11150) TaxID=655863 RepID=F0XAQ9_GROCL|nr:uncharacterized protein CMQ_3356 [Grosmannia clavigera kw1407]EFX05287.1 hypothetical protein CMQ_3356 [Grosmannia clavigera kw1407]
MATLQSTSFLSRTRSGRVPSARTATATESLAIPQAGAGAGPNISLQAPLSPSNVSIFLTNLRLLDLDLEPDWPDITARTFSTKDAGQGQKRRVQTVEWALYQLFCLWDPEETLSKLQPYFPPADQVQSVNLRAALLRALEQTKKNGTLGRDVIIRKTMLDECRGERLEEVLAVFSSAVLKKVVAEDQLNEGGREQHPAAAKSLALEDCGYTGERTPLTGLILAHRVSLSRDLRAKETARTRYKDFAELLDLKQRSIVQRQECAEALEEAAKKKGGQEVMSDDARLHVWRVVRNNWSGSEQWMEALLCGDGDGRSNTTSKTDRDAVLSTPYDRVWRRVQAGRLGELEGHGGRGLLEQLDKRANLQHERLQKWQDYRRTVFKKSASEESSLAAKTAAAASAQGKKGIDLGFGAHGGLYPAAASPRKRSAQETAPMRGEYADLIKGLTAELANVDQPSGQQSLTAFLQARTARLAGGAAETRERRSSSGGGLEEAEVSDISDFEDHAAPEQPIAPQTKDLMLSPRVGQRTLLSKASMTFSVTTYDSDEDLEPPAKQWQPSSSRAVSGSVSESRSASLALPPSAHAAAVAAQLEALDMPIRPLQSPPIWPRTPSAKTADEVDRLPQTPVPEVTVYMPDDSPRSPSPSPPPPSSPPDALADEILASMSSGSPSPVKKPRHTLSLAQRTQLSLARTPRGAAMGRMGESSLDFDDDDDEPDLHLLPSRRNTTPVAVKVGNAEDEAPEHEDLVARTRRSMAGFEASRQKAQLERRRSQHQSRQLPSTPSATKSLAHFDTVEEGENTLILAEELMSGEQDDAEAIFRSRPKIKMSPIPSPTRSLSRAE